MLFSCKKDENVAPVYNVDYEISANYSLSSYQFFKMPYVSDPIHRIESPLFTSTNNRSYNGTSYTFYNYRGNLPLNSKTGEYELKLPVREGFRIVRLKIGGETYDIYGASQIRFKVEVP